MAEDSAQAVVRIVSVPEHPFVETRLDQQFVNFDLLLENRSQRTYKLVTLKLSVFDRSGHLEVERELNQNGTPPALDMVGERVLPPGAIIQVLQPFYSFGPEVALSRMHFEFFFMQNDRPAPPAPFKADAVISIDVEPRAYAPAAFCLPLNGLVLVHDGHDFYSHHRRYNLVKRFRADPKTAVSANLYAYDFVSTTNIGLLFTGDPTQKEHWLSYAKPIFAPADGLVIETVSGLSDNTFDRSGNAHSPSGAEAQDPMGFGNHVTIRHADGRVSWLLHMQPHSLRVRVGDHVRTGQFLGNIGFSGDSLFPHLHYTVTGASIYPSQGVPSYFREFVHVVGKQRIPISAGQVDTGDFVESAPGACR